MSRPPNYRQPIMTNDRPGQRLRVYGTNMTASDSIVRILHLEDNELDA